MNRIFVLTAVFVLAFAVRASAEPVEVTAQAKAANAEFLLRATPPSTRAAICLVDTGVNANPDTANVVTRLSLYGLDGFDQSPSLHGTQMAMLMGAPSNGFGMVGVWPGVRILSMQANQPGQDTFEPAAFVTGIDRCINEMARHPIRVIVTTGATEAPIEGIDWRGLQEVVARAHSVGISVVTAAGDFNGRPVGFPAYTPGVLSVGAHDASTGAPCTTTAVGAVLSAPGCSISGAHPVTGAPTTAQSGTSAAAVILAAGLASLYSWRPDLTSTAAEALLTSTASAGRLNLAAAFVAAGLQPVVDPPPAATPAPTPTASPTPPPKPRLARPRVSVRLKGRVLTVRSANRPAGARVVVKVYVRDSKRKFRRTASRTRSSAVIRIRTKRWSRVVVQYTDPTGVSLTSPATTVTQ